MPAAMESQARHRREALPRTASSEGKQPPALTTLPSDCSTSFYASQIGGLSVINYSYTDLPGKLMVQDVYQFFRLAWALPYIVWPTTPTDSGSMTELAPTSGNLWCIAVHGVLIVLQLGFILGVLPAVFLMSVWAATAIVGLCLSLNHVLCMLLNGRGIEYHSSPECAPVLREHAQEQWIFINGVAVGKHWMQSNLDRLALTFKRPILGVHNKTSGIIFDVIECLIQRNCAYATKDVRRAYAIIKEKLYRPDISKVVLILHSQGGIEGGLVLDWLLQEVPQDLLVKLEVYTFGNAANHFNNPHHTMDAQEREQRIVEPASSIAGQQVLGQELLDKQRAGVRKAKLVVETTSSQPAVLTERAIGHIEHYAHTSDFVALWGVLHFVSMVPESNTLPRFIGRVFARTSPRGGHQLVQHYLDGMFPLEKDAETGVFLGCAESNEFVESDVEIGKEGDESADVHEAFEQSWAGTLAEDIHCEMGSGDCRRSTQIVADVKIHASSPILARQASHPRTLKVKDVSRLWQYRNGKSPDDRPRGLVRLATM
ncbi:hypothetical protein CMQ_1361 [Grosmannia clavigera kw1407]|uniref:Uncharacterized protein n=1 Tax=Grosmannia clavigera (strain kw1407 / UAMH 11150) TaxID=655863 RepID=F0XEJ8_GROCL|nr:uncharacterized protein CMQ_1361 [Grosmannia clavigera kw1407]EFX04433.1 hypothetical protein CMQ_1361 [Grosmannia clavigera kw1407]